MTTKFCNPLAVVVIAALAIGCEEDPRADWRRQKIRELRSKAESKTVPTKTIPYCPDGQCVPKRAILIDPSYRVPNYRGGSCVYASLATTLKAIGLPKQADYVTANYWGGETASGLQGRLDAMGIRYVHTHGKQERKYLDAADRAGRPAVVAFKRNHATTFCGWIAGDDGRQAVIIDNNHPGRLELYKEEDFIRQWIADGSWATVVLDGSPVPGSRLEGG